MLLNKAELSRLKVQMLQTEGNVRDEDFKIELKYRKIIRICVASIAPCPTLCLYAVLLIPLFAADEYSMPVYTKLPWIEYADC